MHSPPRSLTAIRPDSNPPPDQQHVPGPRYTLRITFLRAHNLPVADIPTFSSDPYIAATLRFPGTGIRKLHHRTWTVRTTLEPEWNDCWTVANVPASGATLKLKVLDEDEGNHDDVLGVANVGTGRLDGKQKEILHRTEGLTIKKHAWVAFSRIVTVGCRKGKWRGLGGEVEVEIEVIGSTEKGNEQDEEWRSERAYTVSPNWWTQHFSPLIGIITHTTTSDNGSGGEGNGNSNGSVRHFAFAAHKIQLSGPVPPQLYQRYVAYRPIIKTFYTKSGLTGMALNRALKHQYHTVYRYNKDTAYGNIVPEDIAKKFLDFTHWGAGGRLYTYVLTIDAEWRFTETGKEFSIQMLSKHTMHSCISVYVAFAGEFFVRPRKNLHHKPTEGHIDDYELVIDNDSGTYRPPKENVAILQEFMEKRVPGLKVRAADAFDDEHIKEKKEHVAEKERGRRGIFKQHRAKSRGNRNGSDRGSISSSDEEELRTGKLGMGGKMKKKVWDKMEGLDPAGREEGVASEATASKENGGRSSGSGGAWR